MDKSYGDLHKILSTLKVDIQNISILFEKNKHTVTKDVPTKNKGKDNTNMNIATGVIATVFYTPFIILAAIPAAMMGS